MDFLQQLNENQRQAVQHIDAPSLIIAGAGSGKTRVLTYKIAYLLHLGISPSSILALTFTNKAAKEMRERIGKIVGYENARHLWMGTFHSIFAKILRAEAEKIGYTKDFTIYDATDTKSLIKTIVKELNLDEKTYKPATIYARISFAKNNLVTAQSYYQDNDFLKSDTIARIPRTREIFTLYAQRCRQANAMDFDDLLLHTSLLLDTHPEVLKKYQEIFQFILVDEYQDTNFVQYKIVKDLSQKHQRISVVGDDAQSIYSFRGANIGNILDFKKIYPNSKLFKLEQNYRSTQTIVMAANSLIAKNINQIKKTAYSDREIGEPIILNTMLTDYEEGIYVAQKIASIKQEKTYQYDHIAILYRTNSQSRVIEEALRKQGIPYRIYGGLSFYQRKEIKDVIAYFRLAVNPYDEEALKRIINYPARGIGNVTIKKISDAAILHQVSMWEIIGDLLRYNVNINSGTTRKLINFKTLIDSFQHKAETDNAYELGSEIVKATGILSNAVSSQSVEDLSRIDNIQELLKAIHEYTAIKQETDKESEVKLSDFLSEVSLLSDQDTQKDDNTPKVTLMTIHASKGLEFKVVFIVGLEEGLFPSPFANSIKDIEEERRLLYVAITRAEEKCLISYSKSRFRNGSVHFANPSRFLQDIDSKYIEENTDNSISNNHYFKKNWDENDKAHIERNKFRERTTLSTQKKQLTKINTNEKKNVINTDFPIGSFVKHKIFGIGKVQQTYQSDNNDMIVIDFAEKGKKSLLLKFAKLEQMK